LSESLFRSCDKPANEHDTQGKDVTFSELNPTALRLIADLKDTLATHFFKNNRRAQFHLHAKELPSWSCADSQEAKRCRLFPLSARLSRETVVSASNLRYARYAPHLWSIAAGLHPLPETLFSAFPHHMHLFTAPRGAETITYLP